MDENIEIFYLWKDAAKRLRELALDGWWCTVGVNVDGMYLIRKDGKHEEK